MFHEINKTYIGIHIKLQIIIKISKLDYINWRICLCERVRDSAALVAFQETRGMTKGDDSPYS